jgi:ribosome biogenesis GTPase
MTGTGTIARMIEDALVLVSYGSRGVIELPDGRRTRCNYRRAVGRPYCGDHVRVDTTTDQTPMVTEILPRTNEFARADSRQRKQVIAANLDQVFIVIAPEPEPSRDLLERYLVAVHSLDIRPVIVVNKAELLNKGESSSHKAFTRLDEYRALGYEVLTASCMSEPGISTLKPALTGKTSILVGQSGVGKSSLANALIPDLGLQTGALSRSTGKGVHTTTTTIMYKLPSGGKLLDSPGVWEYGLWEMGPADLVYGFREFAPFPGDCRFRNCRHAGEPDCAVEAAAASGKILQWRYESYRRLLAQSG